MITEAYAGSCSSPIQAVPPEISNRPSAATLLAVGLLALLAIYAFSRKRRDRKRR